MRHFVRHVALKRRTCAALIVVIALIGFFAGGRAVADDVTTAPPACSPSDPLVWLSLPDRLVFTKDDARYGATRDGRFLCRSAAIAAGGVDAARVTTAAAFATPPAVSVLDNGSHAGAANFSPAPTSCDCAGVNVFYATDRKRAGGGTNVDYGPERDPAEALKYGVATVTIPRDHRLGALESPDWFRLEFSPSPDKHVMLRKIAEEPEAQALRQIRSTANGAKTHEVLVLVHGYRVSFQDAVRRVAQMKYDLAFDGAAIAYSWPSNGKLLDYTGDENNATWTEPHFRTFLERLSAQMGTLRIHLVAHSMGNRILTDVLSDMGSRGTKLTNVADAVLAAPDVDRGVFLQRVAHVEAAVPHVVLYASVNDRALKVSDSIHHYTRAGDASVITTAKGLETIDASAVDTTLDGHGYYADNASVLSDIFYVIRGYPTPRFRLRQVADTANLTFWRFIP